MGAADLQRQQTDHDLPDNVEDTLREMCQTLVQHLEGTAKLTGDSTAGVVKHGSVELQPDTALRLLEALNRSMEGIISLTSSREMVSFAFCLVTGNARGMCSRY